MPLNKEELEKKKIDVLLAEYQACHRNRNHYDSVCWTIGSIFIAISLTLFGISFIEEVRNGFWEVLLIGVLSVLLMLIWYAYSQHVNMYVLESILRLHEIEHELRGMGFNIKLHEAIYKRAQHQVRGAWITFILLAVVLGAWFLRMSFLSKEFCWKIVPVILCAIALLVFYIIHWYSRWGSRKDVRDDIASVCKKDKMKE